MLNRIRVSSVSLTGILLLGTAFAYAREPESLVWTFGSTWNNQNKVTGTRTGGGNFLEFDNASNNSCRYDTVAIVVFVTPARSNLTVDSYSATSGEAPANHQATCVVHGMNTE